MMVFVRQRDDDPKVPPQRVWVIEDRYANEVAVAESRLAELEAYTDSEWAHECDELNGNMARTAAQITTQKAETRRRFERMVGFVNAWKVPTPEHQGLKDFMLSQLQLSIDHDCDTTYWESAGKPISVEEYRSECLTDARKAVERRKKSLSDEEERIAFMNSYAAALYESLDAFEANQAAERARAL